VNRATPWSVYVGVTIAFLATFFLRFQTAEFVNDHFTHLSRARQIVLGEWPIRDFFDPGQFLHYYFSAAAQIIFGYNLFGEALLTVAFVALGAALSYHVSWRLTRSHTIAACTTALEVMSFPRLYNYPKVFLYAAAVWLAWWYAERPARARIPVLAAFTVLAFLFRYDHGLYVGVMTVVLLALLHAKRPREWLTTSGAYAGLCCLLLLPFAVYVQWAYGLQRYVTASLIPARMVQRRVGFQQTLTFSTPQSSWVAQYGSADTPPPSDPGAPAPSSADEGRTPRFHFAEDPRQDALALFYWTTVLLPFAALLTVAWAWWRGTIGGPEAATVATIAGFCVMLWRTMMVDNPDARLADVAAPVAIVSAWTAGHWLGSAPGISRLSARDVLKRASVMVIFLTTAWSISTQAELISKLQRYRITEGPLAAADEFKNTYRRLHLRPINDWAAPPADQHGIRALARYVMRCTAPSDRLFIAGAFDPQVYFYTERPFAGGMVHFMRPWHASLPEQRVTIERLERQKVPIALILDLGSFQRGFSYVADYIHTWYTEVAYSTFDEDAWWHVLVDRRLNPVGVDPTLGLPCYRPPGQG